MSRLSAIASSAVASLLTLTASTSALAADGAPQSEGPTARVHIESEVPATLEYEAGRRDWRFACAAPCDADLPISRHYRISGSDIRNSAPFYLAAGGGGRVTIEVSPAARSAFTGGIVLVSVGPAAMIIGLVVVVVSSMSHVDCTESGCSTSSSGPSGVGIGMIVGGAIGTVAGIVMLASNARSGADQSISGAAQPNDAWKRLPVWREDPIGAAAARSTTVPVVQASF